MISLLLNYALVLNFWVCFCYLLGVHVVNDVRELNFSHLAWEATREFDELRIAYSLYRVG